MKSEPAVRKIRRPCMLRSTVVETRLLIVYASLRDVLEQEPKPDDPITITVNDAMKLSGLSRATINRLIAAGRAEAVAA